ncbi:hypothetical protein AWB78_08054 [Caballeronia calidae]|uniref:Uncharacterized protein n=1 Tax=Caballeronia calidae TaxID=1777139 RepID=A0A158EHU8_9BURK|nr:hypothetical protein [Caballeronia calidae]SAL06408.1 hypothetical protein AWB78_08054 [Caballeronia calidae]
MITRLVVDGQQRLLICEVKQMCNRVMRVPRCWNFEITLRTLDCKAMDMLSVTGFGDFNYGARFPPACGLRPAEGPGAQIAQCSVQPLNSSQRW